MKDPIKYDFLKYKLKNIEEQLQNTELPVAEVIKLGVEHRMIEKRIANMEKPPVQRKKKADSTRDNAAQAQPTEPVAQAA